jgi:hypothetical protein
MLSACPSFFFTINPTTISTLRIAKKDPFATPFDVHSAPPMFSSSVADFPTRPLASP